MIPSAADAGAGRKSGPRQISMVCTVARLWLVAPATGFARLSGSRSGYSDRQTGREATERRPVMGIGVSVFLIAVGAILTFALNLSVGFLELDVVGWILMAAGVIGLIVTMVIWGGRRRSVVTTQPTEVRRVEERRDVDVL
jgi:Domain of unknown function (DUF6458)